MIDYERISKECFWDLDIDEDFIRKISDDTDSKYKGLLFEKILLNSTKLFEDLKLFNLEDLNQLLSNFTIPKFNYEYIFRRKNIAEVYFFDAPLLVEELKWKI